MRNPPSRGKLVEDGLRAHLRAVQNGPADPGHERPIIEGVSPGGVCVGVTLDNFMAQAGRILIDSGRVFRWQGTLVYEFREPDNQELQLLCVRGRAEPHAASLLTNLFGVGVQGEESMSQCLVPSNLVGALLADEGLWRRLPRVECYSRRPVFDAAYRLCGPGYHPASKLLIHGPDVAPITAASPAAEKAIDRLPPRLQGLLKDFCFESPADLVHAVAVLLSGVLANLLVACGKPPVVISGNRAGVGKTLLGVVFGVVLDGAEPPLIHPSQEEDELAKRIGTRIKPGSECSLLFFDNCRGSIGGSLLESLALRPRVNVRRLGHNEDITHTNNFLWVFTANHARATTDMTSRALLIRLHYEGDPRCRFADSDTEEEGLKRHALQHRAEILGELLGLVLRWRDCGCPRGPRSHRQARWAELVGGVLAVAGLPEFLSNQDRLNAEVDEDLEQLAALADHVVGRRKAGFFTEDAAAVGAGDFGKTAGEWAPHLREAGLLPHERGAGPERALAIAAGRFLGGRLDRAVPVVAGDRAGTATLRAQPGRSRQRRYGFVVAWDPPAPADDTPPAGEGSSGAAPSGSQDNTPSPNPTAPPAPPVPGPPPPPTTGTLSPQATAGAGNDLNW
jgi:hypothetical protein